MSGLDSIATMDFSNLPRVAKLALLLAAVFITYTLYTQLTVGRRQRALARSKGCLPAPRFPQKDKMFGFDLFKENLANLKARKGLEAGQKRFQQMGVNTLQFVALGTLRTMTLEPENLKTIQATEFKKWGLGTRRKNGFRPLLGDGIFTTDGAAWQHSRNLLRPNFTRSQVGDLPTFEKHVAHLINAIPQDNTTVDLGELFFRLTIDSATEFLFGESTDSLTNSSKDNFAESFNRGQDYISNKSRWGKLSALFPANKTFPQDSKFVHDFVDYYVRKGRAKRPELLQRSPDEKGPALDPTQPTRYVFLDELVRQTTDPLQIRSELLNILLAGRDTTASLLTNTWFVLSHRPDIWRRLQSDIATLNNAPPTFEQLKNLKYLRALLNESLRLHPVVPGNSREALEDTTLPLGGGPDGRAPLFIPRGHVVVWSVYAMHRRPDFYGPDAEDFKPERWLDDEGGSGKKGLRPGWEYLPFNGGARICLGQQFALTEAGYATVRLCQAFAGIEARGEGVWREGLTLTCVNADGAKVGLTRR